MPLKKKTAKRRVTKRKASTEPHVYRMPHTAAELGIDCSICHAPATQFDYGRGKNDHRSGFVCDSHPTKGQCERLLVKEGAAAITGAL